jgi:hypothetical protein
VTGHEKGGDREPPAVAFAVGRPPVSGIQEVLNRNLEDRSHFARGWLQRRALVGRREDGMQPEAADRNVQRSEISEYADRVEREGHFLVGFAQRRLVEGLARIDGAARQGHLAPMASKCTGPHGQHDMCALGNGKHKQQAGRIPNA